MTNPIRPMLRRPGAVRAILLLPCLAFMAGCVVEEPRVRRTVYVPAPPPPNEVVLIEAAPPPPREEIIVEQPSPAHLWIRGYWGWQGGRHVWLGGHWELPPRPGVVWVEPRWEHRERGYVFIAGSWRNGSLVVNERVTVQPSVNVRLNFVAVPPPPPRREIILEAQRPSRDHVWIKGYWIWHDGRHVWREGHWERPPHPRAVWVEPRWEHRAEGHVFIEGYWR